MCRVSRTAAGAGWAREAGAVSGAGVAMTLAPKVRIAVRSVAWSMVAVC